MTDVTNGMDENADLYTVGKALEESRKRDPERHKRMEAIRAKLYAHESPEQRKKREERSRVKEWLQLPVSEWIKMRETIPYGTPPPKNFFKM